MVVLQLFKVTAAQHEVVSIERKCPLQLQKSAAAPSNLVTETFKCSSRSYYDGASDFGIKHPTHLIQYVRMYVQCNLCCDMSSSSVLCVQGHSYLSCCHDVCVRFAYADSCSCIHGTCTGSTQSLFVLGQHGLRGSRKCDHCSRFL